MLVWSYRSTDLWLLHSLLPDIFTYDWALRHSLSKTINHFFLLGSLYTCLTSYFVGLREHGKIQKIERAFKKVGIKNSLGEYPKVLEVKKVADLRSRVRLLTDGIDLSDFTTKSGALETSLRSLIEDVRREEDPQFVNLYLTNKRIPKKILYRDVCQSLTEPYTFIVGKSLGDVITQDISSLPHMLTGGATGSGKSVFLEQVLMGLLDFSPRLQVYLLDLKNGLELRDFTICPNVEMVKDVSSGLLLLIEVRDEMRRRFNILEKSGHKRIDPERDKLDRIVVCIDEASVLYGTWKVNAADKENAAKASEITDEIAKLSRAAGIHLILATQKVTKETINTHIQENLEGRMCFEVNSIQGSTVLLGNASAKDLPHIPGRGIWKVGSKMVEVQTPYIDEEEIKTRCQIIRDDFEGGKRALHQPMLSTKKVIEASSEEVDVMAPKKGRPTRG